MTYLVDIPESATDGYWGGEGNENKMNITEKAIKPLPSGGGYKAIGASR